MILFPPNVYQNTENHIKQKPGFHWGDGFSRGHTIDRYSIGHTIQGYYREKEVLTRKKRKKRKV